jgi:DNA-binding LacI/PurR family transcriptional regulator/DNA-binding transcriptional regulator YhcF (GntR family)
MNPQRHLLYERLYHYVLDDIRKGSLRSGDRVPSEKELARKHGVSRITSMRALQNLERAGLVVRIRGKGTFVKPDLDRLPELNDGEHPPRSRRLTSRIAFLIPDASPAYGLELLNAIEERAGQNGLSLVLKRSRGEQEEEERAIEALVRSGSVDGMIVFPVNGEFYNASLLRLALAKRPLVLVDRYLKGIAASSVYTDNLAAARELTGCVLDSGHKHLAFVSSPPANTSSIEDRLHGFRAAFSQRGLGLGGQHLLTELTSGFPNPESGIAADHEAIRAFLERREAITGFVASEYPIALIIRDVLRGMRRLEGTMIACFDSPRGQLSEPRFTHVQQNEREMGRLAVDLLLAQLDGQPTPSQSIVPFELVRVPGAATIP